MLLLRGRLTYAVTQTVLSHTRGRHRMKKQREKNVVFTLTNDSVANARVNLGWIGSPGEHKSRHPQKNKNGQKQKKNLKIPREKNVGITNRKTASRGATGRPTPGHEIQFAKMYVFFFLFSTKLVVPCVSRRFFFTWHGVTATTTTTTTLRKTRRTTGDGGVQHAVFAKARRRRTRACERTRNTDRHRRRSCKQPADRLYRDVWMVPGESQTLVIKFRIL